VDPVAFGLGAVVIRRMKTAEIAYSHHWFGSSIAKDHLKASRLPLLSYSEIL
jgi:hypothetical protein